MEILAAFLIALHVADDRGEVVEVDLLTFYCFAGSVR